MKETNEIRATINRTDPEAKISFIDTRTGKEVNSIPILDIPQMSDEKFRKLSEKQAARVKNPINMTAEEWQAHLAMGKEARQRFADAMTEWEAIEYKASFNQRLINEIIADWDESKIEHIIQVDPDLACPDIEEINTAERRTIIITANNSFIAATAKEHAAFPRKTKRQKARAAAYERLQTELLPEAIHFMLQTYFYGVKDKAFIISEAKRLAEDQAFMFVYEWGQYDDYDPIQETMR